MQKSKKTNLEEYAINKLKQLLNETNNEELKETPIEPVIEEMLPHVLSAIEWFDNNIYKNEALIYTELKLPMYYSDIDKETAFQMVPELEEKVKIVKGITMGSGVDFAFQCTGSPIAHSNIYKFIRSGGGLCELGFFINGGDATINPHFDICSKEITTVGSWVYTLRDYATTFDFLKRAKGIGLPLEKLITHKFPLDQINEAHITNLKMEGLKIAIINE